MPDHVHGLHHFLTRQKGCVVFNPHQPCSNAESSADQLWMHAILDERLRLAEEFTRQQHHCRRSVPHLEVSSFVEENEQLRYGLSPQDGTNCRICQQV